MEKVDITIIGAGVIGLAIGAKLACLNKQIFILEKNTSFGMEASSRNSEVIHAGMNYKTGSLKAKMCVRGNNLLYKLCEKREIGFDKTGKLIIARDESEMKDIERIKVQGEQNGVKGLEILSKKELKKTEPNVKGFGALWSSSTGIINSHELMDFYVKQFKKEGGVIVYDSEVTNIEPASRGYVLTIKKENYHFLSKIVINAAGLFSDHIASMAGIDIDGERYRLKYCKGEYFSLRRKLDVSRLIYAVPPDELGLGIHLVIDLAGGMRLGPNAFYVDNVDYKTNPDHKHEFYTTAKDYLDDINEEDLFPDTAGIRSRRQHDDGDGFRDFIIKEESIRGLPNFINLIGIESPGLTAAPAIAEYVASLVLSMPIF